MMNSFTPGQLIYPVRERDRITPFLVIEAKRLRTASAGWILTVMKLDGSSEVITTYFDSADWSKINT